MYYNNILIALEGAIQDFNNLLTTPHTLSTLEGAIQDFNNLLTAPHALSSTYTHVARVQLCADHVPRIERLSCVATCRVSRDMKRQLSYKA